MDLIRFIGSTDIISVNLSISDGRVTINSIVLPTDEELTSGFQVLNEHNGIVQGDYSAYKYIYRKESDCAILTSDPLDIYVEPKYVTISYAASNGGYVSLDSETIQVNADVVSVQGAIATPSYGYQFKNWTDGNGNEVSTASGFTPTVSEDSVDVTYIANFELIPIPEKTLDEVKSEKEEAVSIQYNEAMATGTKATLSDGSEIYFGINQDFINDAMAAFNLASALYDTENITVPFEINKVCYQYKPIDVIYIYISMQIYIVAMKSLRNELLGTIDRLETKEAVEAIEYKIESLDEEGLSGYQASMLSGQNMINVLKAKFKLADPEPSAEDTTE